MSALYWRDALWLWAIALPLALPLLALRSQRQRLARIIEPALLPWALDPSRHHGGARRRLLFLAWALLCVALAGPRTVAWAPPEVRPADASVAVVIDFSASMAASDLRPTRRQAAIDSLRQWLDQSRQPPAIGLFVYAGRAHQILPPTSDRRLVDHFLSRLDRLATPTLGNDLAGAIELAADALKRHEGFRSLLLLSDGDMEPAALDSAIAAIEQAVPDADIHLTVVGLGGAEKVALPAALASEVLQQDRAVLTRRETASLKALASAGGGRYLPAESLRGQEIDTIATLPVARIDPDDAGRVLWNEWFALPLLAAIGLLLLALRGSGGTTAALALMLFSGGVLWQQPLLAAVSAEELLAQGDYAAARERFARQKGFRARFGEGIACYRLKDWTCARQAFARAAWLAPDDATRGRAAFNLGNAHFQLGEFEEAAVLFEQAGRFGAPAGPVRRNLEFANDLAESLRKYRIHLEMVQRKAERLAAARDIPEGLLEKMTEGVWLDLQNNRPDIIRRLGRERVRQLIHEGVARSLGIAPKSTPPNRQQWTGNNRSRQPKDSIGLLNRLLPLEAGIGAVPERPYRLEGARPW